MRSPRRQGPGTEGARQNAGNLGTEFDESMLQELQTELSSASPNAEVYANLHNSAARRVRLATLENRKKEWITLGTARPH